MSDNSHEVAGESRRDFLKKAGKVAWVVPTIQVVNMAAAAAGVEGSMVTTTSSTSTTSTTSTTTTTTTTEPPECTEYRVCRIKADWTGQGWDSDSGVGANDCIQNGDWARCEFSDVGAQISGDERVAVVTVPDHCEIMQASHKAGQSCVSAAITNGGRTATFTADPQDISHVELVVKCCVDDVE